MPRLSEKSFHRPARVVHVAPGVTTIPTDVRTVPAVCVSDLVWHNVVFKDGSHGRALVPVDRVWDRWMRLSEIESKLRLGLSAEVINKLWRGGFITGSQAAPNNILIDIVTLLEHIETTANDPDFWGGPNSSNRIAYRDGRHGSFTN